MMHELEFLGLTIADYKLSLDSVPMLKVRALLKLLCTPLVQKQYEYLDLAKLTNL